MSHGVEGVGVGVGVGVTTGGGAGVAVGVGVGVGVGLVEPQTPPLHTGHDEEHCELLVQVLPQAATH